MRYLSRIAAAALLATSSASFPVCAQGLDATVAGLGKLVTVTKEGEPGEHLFQFFLDDVEIGRYTLTVVPRR